eukprot:TRINITY_DN68109_c0_g1_i1.p1 TRINITY_DN68109_c0_g1~~TRINITY_DN68109_c0_g1_i1.p1  ORF type:complete len:855 (+),score=150.16 TRINITY_DN68109_c0_g1_i1:96-2660(+)
MILLDGQQNSAKLEDLSCRSTFTHVDTARLRDALQELKSKSAHNKVALTEAGESGQRLLAEHSDLRQRLAYLQAKVRASIEGHSTTELVFDNTHFGGSSSSSATSRNSSRSDNDDASSCASGHHDVSQSCGTMRYLTPRKSVRRSCQVELEAEIQRLRERNAGFEEAIVDSEKSVLELQPAAGRHPRRSSSGATRAQRVHVDEGTNMVPKQEAELRQLQASAARREKTFFHMLAEQKEELETARQQSANCMRTMRSKLAAERARNEQLGKALHEEKVLTDRSVDSINQMIDELSHEVEDRQFRRLAAFEALNKTREELTNFEAGVSPNSIWPVSRRSFSSQELTFEERCSFGAEAQAPQRRSSLRLSRQQSWLRCANEHDPGTEDVDADSDGSESASVLGTTGFAETAVGVDARYARAEDFGRDAHADSRISSRGSLPNMQAVLADLGSVGETVSNDSICGIGEPLSPHESNALMAETERHEDQKKIEKEDSGELSEKYEKKIEEKQGERNQRSQESKEEVVVTLQAVSFAVNDIDADTLTDDRRTDVDVDVDVGKGCATGTIAKLKTKDLPSGVECSLSQLNGLLHGGDDGYGNPEQSAAFVDGGVIQGDFRELRRMSTSTTCTDAWTEEGSELGDSSSIASLGRRHRRRNDSHNHHFHVGRAIPKLSTATSNIGEGGKTASRLRRPRVACAFSATAASVVHERATAQCKKTPRGSPAATGTTSDSSWFGALIGDALLKIDDVTAAVSNATSSILTEDVKATAVAYATAATDMATAPTNAAAPSGASDSSQGVAAVESTESGGDASVANGCGIGEALDENKTGEVRSVKSRLEPMRLLERRRVNRRLEVVRES